MSALPQSTRMTEAEYLAYERDSEAKHELIDGEIFAMTGASREHNLISGAAYAGLFTQLKGKGCELYPSDMRVKIVPWRMYTYPDLSLVCGEPKFADHEFDTLLNPVLLIEVLSPSTERYDRGRKFQAYRSIPSLKEYLLIAQDELRIERYFRLENELWEFTDVQGLDAEIALKSVDAVLKLSDIYEQVTFTNEPE